MVDLVEGVTDGVMRGRVEVDLDGVVRAMEEEVLEGAVKGSVEVEDKIMEEAEILEESIPRSARRTMVAS